MILTTQVSKPENYATGVIRDGCLNIWSIPNSVYIDTSRGYPIIAFSDYEKRCAPPDQAYYYYVHLRIVGWSPKYNNWKKLSRTWGNRLWADGDFSAIDEWGVYNASDLTAKGRTCKDYDLPDPCESEKAAIIETCGGSSEYVDWSSWDDKECAEAHCLHIEESNEGPPENCP